MSWYSPCPKCGEPTKEDCSCNDNKIKKMEKILSAKQFLNMAGITGDKGELRFDQLEYLLVGFAKLHVQAALECAAKESLVEAEPESGTIKRKKEFEVGPENGVSINYVFSVDEYSIINAYPLENIK